MRRRRALSRRPRGMNRCCCCCYCRLGGPALALSFYLLLLPCRNRSPRGAAKIALISCSLCCASRENGIKGRPGSLVCSRRRRRRGGHPSHLLGRTSAPQLLLLSRSPTRKTTLRLLLHWEILGDGGDDGEIVEPRTSVLRRRLVGDGGGGCRDLGRERKEDGVVQ